MSCRINLLSTIFLCKYAMFCDLKSAKVAKWLGAWGGAPDPGPMEELFPPPRGPILKGFRQLCGDDISLDSERCHDSLIKAMCR